MKINIFLFILGVLFLGNSSELRAQILNGDFSAGLTDWTSLGVPQAGSTGLTPPSGTTEALIQSTDIITDPTLATSVPVLTIDATLGVTLPSTSGTPPPSSGVSPGTFAPTDGQAIYQTFSISAPATLSFAYSFQTEDYYPFDSVGYVLDGVYTQLASPGAYSPGAYSGSGFTAQTDYVTLTLNLSAGQHTLGFVAYNTNDDYSSSILYVADVETTPNVPEPAEWALIALGIGGLVLARKWRSRFS